MTGPAPSPTGAPPSPDGDGDRDGDIDRAQRDQTRLARGGALNLAGSVVSAVATFVLVIIVTNNLGAAGSGAFFLATALFQVVTTAGQLGADTGLGRFIPRSIAHRRPQDVWAWTRLALVPVVLVGLVTGALVFVFADPLADLLANGRGRADFVTYVRILAPFIFLGALYFTLQTGSRAFGTMRPSVVIERLARPVAQPIAMVAVFALGMGPAAVAWAWIGPYAAAAVALAYWYARQVRRAERRASRPGAGPEPAGTGSGAPASSDVPVEGGIGPDARTFWRFAGPRAVASLFQVAVRYLDVLIVGALASTRAAGIYSATSRWLIAGTFIVFAINQAFQPQISAMLARAETVRSQALFQSATAWAVALVWPFYLALAVFGPVLIRVFGRGFAEGADALVILAVGGMIGAACGPVDMVLLMGGRSSATLVSAAIGLALNVGVNIALVPTYGFVGAAIAWSASLAGTNLVGVWQVRHLIGRPGYGATWLRAVAAAVLGAGVPLLLARLLIGATPLGLAAGLGAGAVIYGSVLWRWRDIVPVDVLLAARKGRQRPVA